MKIPYQPNRRCQLFGHQNISPYITKGYKIIAAAVSNIHAGELQNRCEKPGDSHWRVTECDLQDSSQDFEIPGDTGQPLGIAPTHFGTGQNPRVLLYSLLSWEGCPRSGRGHVCPIIVPQARRGFPSQDCKSEWSVPTFFSRHTETRDNRKGLSTIFTRLL